MSITEITTVSVEAVAVPAAPQSAKYWHAQLDAAKKRDKNWRKRARAVLDKYRDERDAETLGATERRINVLWANTQVLKSALFTQLGSPDVRRTFPKPGKAAAAARAAALVLERALTSCAQRYSPDRQIRDAVEDFLLPGRGVCWLEYEATVEEPEPDEEGEDGESEAAEGPECDCKDAEESEESVAPRITKQKVQFCHVVWDDFLHGQSKRWDDVPWVARRLLFTKSDLSQFPEHEGKVQLTYTVDDEESDRKKDDDDTHKRAVVWEIWSKNKSERLYIAEGYDYILQAKPDPYNIEGFFPCPPPLYGCKTTDNLEPIPLYCMYQDQVEELNRVTTRINRLVEFLKVCGVYDSTLEESDVLSDLGSLEDGQYAPYKGAGALADRGGLASAFMNIDIAPVVAAIQGLMQQREALLTTIYEISGISDIMRGRTAPDETFGAQQLKARYGSARLQDMKREVQDFVRALYRMQAEIMGEHFERDALAEMSGIRLPLLAEQEQAKQVLEQIAQAQQQAAAMQAQQGAQGLPGQPPAPPMAPQPPMPQLPPPEVMTELQQIVSAVPWEDVAAVLRSDDRRNYQIDVETDLTVHEDDLDEKQARGAFVSSTMELLTTGLPAVAQMPALGNILKELVLFSAGAHKVSRTLEDTLNDAFVQIQNSPPPATPPDPAAEAQLAITKAKAEEAQINVERARQTAALELQMKQAELQIKQVELEIRRQELQLGVEERRQRIQVELAGKAQKAELDLAERTRKAEIAAVESEAKRADREHKMQMDAIGRQIDHDTKATKAAHDHQLSVQDAEFQAHSQRLQAQHEHEQRMRDMEHKDAQRKSKQKDATYEAAL